MSNKKNENLKLTTTTINNQKSKNLRVNTTNMNNKKRNNDYKNLIYYPSSSKEWFNSVYSYNKSYNKLLVNTDIIINNLFRNYLNMAASKVKKVLKRRRVRKNRSSANRIYTSRAEIKHTNTKVIIILYTYNKQKYLLEQWIKSRIQFIKNKKQKYLLKQTYFKYKSEIILKKSRLLSIIKRRFFEKDFFFCDAMNDLYLWWNMKGIHYKFYKMSSALKKLVLIKKYSLKKDLFLLEEAFFNYAKTFNFNKSKFTNLLLNLRNVGLLSLLHRIYNKNIELKIIELKSIQLNSDIFSSTIALKLRNRKNRAMKILSKALLCIVRIPYLHSFLISDDFITKISKNNILNFLMQRVVSGVRFETSGRLTRRLTASRAVFKYRYAGSLKNIRSSYNTKSAVMLRGHIKANLQYILINSKTRNGAFGLKGWVSSH